MYLVEGLFTENAEIELYRRWNEWIEFHWNSDLKEQILNIFYKLW